MIQCPHCFSIGDSILSISHKKECIELIISKSHINIHLVSGAGGSGAIYKVIDLCTSL